MLPFLPRWYIPHFSPTLLCKKNALLCTTFQGYKEFKRAHELESRRSASKSLQKPASTLYKIEQFNGIELACDRLGAFCGMYCCALRDKNDNSIANSYVQTAFLCDGTLVCGVMGHSGENRFQRRNKSPRFTRNSETLSTRDDF